VPGDLPGDVGEILFILNGLRDVRRILRQIGGKSKPKTENFSHMWTAAGGGIFGKFRAWERPTIR